MTDVVLRLTAASDCTDSVLGGVVDVVCPLGLAGHTGSVAVHAGAAGRTCPVTDVVLRLTAASDCTDSVLGGVVDVVCPLGLGQRRWGAEPGRLLRHGRQRR